MQPSFYVIPRTRLLHRHKWVCWMLAQLSLVIYFIKKAPPSKAEFSFIPLRCFWLQTKVGLMFVGRPFWAPQPLPSIHHLGFVLFMFFHRALWPVLKNLHGVLAAMLEIVRGLMMPLQTLTRWQSKRAQKQTTGSQSTHCNYHRGPFYAIQPKFFVLFFFISCIHCGYKTIYSNGCN